MSSLLKLFIEPGGFLKVLLQIISMGTAGCGSNSMSIIIVIVNATFVSILLLILLSL